MIAHGRIALLLYSLALPILPDYILCMRANTRPHQLCWPEVIGRWQLLHVSRVLHSGWLSMGSRPIFRDMCHDKNNPVFDHLQCAKTERKAYEISHPMDDLSVSTWVDRKGEVSERVHVIFVRNKWWVFSFKSFPPLSTCTSVDMDIIHEVSQGFPLHVCILQSIKNWSWGRPGNKTRLGFPLSFVHPTMH